MIRVEKPKIPKHLSYVLKTSLIENALKEANIEWAVMLQYWIPKLHYSILQAQYWTPNQNVAYPRLYIRAGVVRAEERKSAQELLITQGIPVFVRWLQAIHALPENSTKLLNRPFFDATYNGKTLSLSYKP